MAKDPAFLFYPGDYLRDTQNLSEKSQVAYDRIMCEHMRNICIRHSQLKFFTKRLSPDEIEELLMVLTETDEGYQITWVAESIEKRRAYSESRRKNRTKNKANSSKKTSKTYVAHMENEIENENKDVTNSLEKSEKLFLEITSDQIWIEQFKMRYRSIHDWDKFFKILCNKVIVEGIDHDAAKCQARASSLALNWKSENNQTKIIDDAEQQVKRLSRM